MENILEFDLSSVLKYSHKRWIHSRMVIQKIHLNKANTLKKVKSRKKSTFRFFLCFSSSSLFRIHFSPYNKVQFIKKRRDYEILFVSRISHIVEYFLKIHSSLIEWWETSIWSKLAFKREKRRKKDEKEIFLHPFQMPKIRLVFAGSLYEIIMQQFGSINPPFQIFIASATFLNSIKNC